MATFDRRYYYLPRRLVNGLLLGLVAAVLIGGGGLWALAPAWLPQVALALDVDVPIAKPDVVVLSAGGQSQAMDRRVVGLLAAGETRAVVLLGAPFTADVLVPQLTSPRVGALTALGAPPAAIVEVYAGNTLYESLEALREVARVRGWRTVLFYGAPPGTRRDYLAARRILGAAGIAVGVETVPSPQFDSRSWWYDNRDRGRVVFAWLDLVLGWETGRY